MDSLTEPMIIALAGSLLSLKLLATWSHIRNAAQGLRDGRLCTTISHSNMVCSEGDQANTQALKAEQYEAWDELQDVLESMSGRFITLQEEYLHAVFKTPIFGFSQDFEARWDKDAGCIHVRSASRVGISDLGSNSQRIEKIRYLMQ
ncbi:DUF1499 domain-containing protein [Rubritalea marina]|uniref:DUF1499 domain-containing protein n=1 Tax=Rubritalea marina TaxID=361055 RepID=UPI00036547B0|nr:DUF1499 domain-containing protein [Rubritalea marina]